MKTSARAVWRPLLPCLLSAALWAAPSARAQAQLDFDFAAAHEFLGFGAQVWLNNKNPSASSQMLRDINARFVRVALVPKVPLRQLRPGLSVDEYYALLQAHDSAEQRQRFTAFRDQMKALNISPVLIFFRMPEPWVDTQSKRTGSKAKASYAKVENLGDYANLIAAQVLYSTRLGIAPAAVELVNEPHGAWSTKIEPADYVTLVQKARAAMDKHGLQSVRIAGPGVGLREFDTYIGAVAGKGAASAIGFASAHIYAEPQVLANAATPGIQNFLGRGKHGPIMITEFGLKNDDDRAPSSQPGTEASSPEFALAAAADAVQLLGLGANALIYWQLQDFDWQKKTHGMMTEAGERRPVAQAMQALFQRVPPGAKVAGVRSSVQGLYATALQAEGRSYLMLANLSGRPQAFTARWRGGAACGQQVEVSGWVAGGGSQGALQGAQAGACELKATVAKDTVATVVLR